MPLLVQSLNCVQLFVTLWTAAHQASLSFTIAWSLLKLMFIQLVMPSNHLILCSLVLLLPSVFASIRVFSDELSLHIRWPKYWSFSFSLSPSSEDSGLIPFRIDRFDHYYYAHFIDEETDQKIKQQAPACTASKWQSLCSKLGSTCQRLCAEAPVYYFSHP